MIRAWIKVDPDTGEVVGYSEGSVKWDENGEAIPIPEINGHGCLQIEVELRRANERYEVDLSTMATVKIASGSAGDPSDHSDPAYLQKIVDRKASAQALLDSRGVPLNPVRIRPEVSGDVP